MNIHGKPDTVIHPTLLYLKTSHGGMLVGILWPNVSRPPTFRSKQKRLRGCVEVKVRLEEPFRGRIAERRHGAMRFHLLSFPVSR